MSVALRRPATPDGLFLWVMHRFSEVFEEHAILKGGMALRLLDCPRSTTDIDYVLIPYRSKKDVLERLERVLREIDGGEVRIDVHSKRVRALLEVDGAGIQVEVNVAEACPAMPVSTAGFAEAQHQPPRVVRVMALDRALAMKLAGWNERRLLRDLYDAYYLSARLGQAPDLTALDERLQNVESRQPGRRARRAMTRARLAEELRSAAEELDEAAVNAELAPVLPEEEVAGLVPRLRSAVVGLAERLEASAE